jgi:aminocarboxymuconate-semialdehyde decarboxylase
VFAGIYDRHPGLKLIAHHGGGLIPHFSGRVERMPVFTAMAPDLGEALSRLEKKPIECLRMLYVDTAMFGSLHGLRCVVDFFGPEHVLFGTDAPFDTEGGMRRSESAEPSISVQLAAGCHARLVLLCEDLSDKFSPAAHADLVENGLEVTWTAGPTSGFSSWRRLKAA